MNWQELTIGKRIGAGFGIVLILLIKGGETIQFVCGL